MAKAPPKPEAEGTEAPKGGSKKLLIIIVALVLLLVAAGGGLAFMLVAKKKHPEGEADAHQEEAAKTRPVAEKGAPPTFVPIDPFTVNLAPENGDHFLQAVLVFKVTDHKAGEDMKVYMPEIRHRVNLILSSRRPSELVSIEGREDLADEIMEETNDVLGYPPAPKRATRRAVEPTGPVIAVLFNTFIVQ